MRAFKTAAHALVSHTIAITVAGLLIKHFVDLRGQLVGVRLERILIVVSPELFPSKDRRQLRSCWRRCGVECRDTGFFCFLLRNTPWRRNSDDHNNKAQSDCAFEHTSSAVILTRISEPRTAPVG